MARVVVAGALANKPGQPGEAWVKLSWVRGLERLGIDVWFTEQLAPSIDQAAAATWFESVTGKHGLAGRATLLDDAGDTITGLGVEELRDVASAATLVNISGHLTLPALRAAFRRRVMVDIDPGYTQFWHAAGLAGAHVEGHDVHFTIGELIGTPECEIPTGGVAWLPVHQPVVLEDWPVAAGDRLERFTTVASWRGAFGAVEHLGRRYGLKVHEFRKYLELPLHSPHAFEVALDIDPADAGDLAALRDHGWTVTDPRRVAGDLEAFRRYVRHSGAEFSVAQGIYVETRSGWFSDRTTRYLAAGRPALVQDTGFSRRLPTGTGLVSFTTIEEAVAGAADIARRYPEHRTAARAIAEEHFRAERVLARFCEQAGIE